MSKFRCRICGKLFERVGNGVYCEGPHYRPCPVCGKPVAYQRPSDPYKCCSKECADKLADESKKSKKIKICRECGQEFHPRQGTQVYCDRPHRSRCVVCGKEFEYTCRPTEKPKTCSRKCQEELRSLTAMKRYGVKNVSELDSVKKKISERNSSGEVQEKRRQTNLLRWGVDNPAKNPDIAAKMSAIMSSKEYLEKREQTCIDRYGFRSPMQSDVVKEKIKSTNQSRYGVDWATQSASWKASKIATNLEKYGVPHYCMTEDCKSKQGLTISSRNKSLAELLESELGIKVELEFTLCNRSYDLYLPDKNTLIEVNPTYTHNAVGNHWGKGLDKYYHRDKSKLAEKYGYRCIHIFDWDSIDKIVNMLKPKIPRYARSCEIVELDAHVVSTFEDSYHLQGRVKGQKLCLGLYLDSELIQVMTFGVPRYNKNYEWELLRLCSDNRYAVVGGAEKLWKYFIHNYDPTSVISYCDVSKFSGQVYSKLGMLLKNVVEPNKIWSKGSEMITGNLLLQRGYDQLFHTNYGKGTDNEQLMLDHGWLPVYDCGQFVYEYLKPEAAK